jgi:hypothetical protein
MKKIKKEKKQQQNNSNSLKDLQLPIIQSNIQKGNIKPSPSNSSMPKTNQKPANIKSNLNDIPQILNLPIAKTISKDRKSIVTNLSQSTNKTRTKSGNRKKKLYTYKEEINPNPNNEFIKEEVPRISEEKLSQLKEQRRKRLQQAKIEEEKELKIYTQLIENYKNRSKDKNKIQFNEENSKISKISEQKAQKILEEGGMLDAYKYVLSQLCRHGLPNGNIFEYASIVVKNYEKKWKEKKSKMIKEKIDQYYEEKQKEMNNILESEGEIKKVNKSLEHREEYKFIQSLDKSRSKRNIIPRLFSPPVQENFSGFSRNLNRNFKIKEKTNQSKYENNIIPLKLKQIGLEENNDIIKKNIAKTALSSQYNKDEEKTINNIKVKDMENTNNDNKISTKKKKKSK